MTIYCNVKLSAFTPCIPRKKKNKIPNFTIFILATLYRFYYSTDFIKCNVYITRPNNNCNNSYTTIQPLYLTYKGLSEP